MGVSKGVPADLSDARTQRGRFQLPLQDGLLPPRLPGPREHDGPLDQNCHVIPVENTPPDDLAHMETEVTSRGRANSA